MITYQVESAETILTEGLHLFVEHYKDIAVNQDKIELNPDVPRYMAMDDAGILLPISVREGEELIGYSVSVLLPSLHYKDHVYAMNDVIFVAKEYRKGTVGIRLIKFTEEELQKRGVSVYCINSKVHAPFFSVLERLGFTDTEHQYTKYIGK